MEQEVQSIEHISPQPKGSSKNSLKIVAIFIIVLIVLGGLGFGATKFLGSKDGEASVTPTPTVGLIVLPTSTPTPEATISASVTPTTKSTAKATTAPTTAKTTTPTTTIKPTQTTTKTTTDLDRSKLSVEVLNGSGVTGAAKKAADALKELGYSIASTGNADADTYEKTVIEVSAAKSSYLDLLKKDLSSYTIGSTSAKFSGTADARIIIGKQ